MQKRSIPWSGRAHNYTKEELDIVVKVASEADPLTQGPYLKQFEATAREYLNVDHAFGITNAANGLELAALLSGLGPGDEVIIPAHTYCATAIPFGRTGATIRWADIDSESFLISPDSIRALINDRTKVIVVVHLYGCACDMEPILSLASERNIFVVEDCAQANGASYDGKKVGSLGSVGVFSFHCQKNITTMGEGGLITTNDDRLADLIYGLRHNGHRSFPDQGREYWKPAMSDVRADIPGIWPYNFSMSEVQAALGSALYMRLDDLNNKRIERAKFVLSELKDFPELQFQTAPARQENVFHLLPARYDGKRYGKTNSDLIDKLHYDYSVKAIVQFYPLYRYHLFVENGQGQANCPETDGFFDNMVSVPFHEWMSNEDLEYLVYAMRSALKELRG